MTIDDKNPVIIKSVRAIVVPDHKPWLSLPAAWLQESDESLPRIISFGQKSSAYTLRKHRGGKERIVISSALQEALLLPLERPLTLYETPRSLHIGPYIGLLTIGDAVHLKRLARTWIRERVLEEGTLYATVDARSVDWETLTVLGTIFDAKTPTAELIPRRLPLPDMLLNKIPSRRWEHRLEQSGFFDRLYELSTARLLNPYYFKKWDIYQRLMIDPRLRMHIPETIRKPSEGDLHRMLHIYGALYLKPEDGYKGKGIYFLQKKGPHLRVSYRTGRQTITETFKSVRLFLNTHLPPEKIKYYVAQQAVKLMQFDARPFDFRAHLVKDGMRTWQMMGLVAKVAGERSITTHLFAGGVALPAKEALQKQAIFDPEALLRLIDDRVRRIAYHLESTYRHPLIELGIDLGFDREGRLYIFEVNAKPGYAVFEAVPALNKKKSAVKRALLSYLTTLAWEAWTYPDSGTNDAAPRDGRNDTAPRDEREVREDDINPSGTNGASPHHSQKDA